MNIKKTLIGLFIVLVVFGTISVATNNARVAYLSQWAVIGTLFAYIIFLMIFTLTPNVFYAIKPKKSTPGQTGGHRAHEDISDDVISEIQEAAGLTAGQKKIVKYGIRKALAKEAEACLGEIQNAEEDEIRTILRQRIDPKVYCYNLKGEKETQRTATKWWTGWFPGFQDDTKLEDLYKTLPGFPPDLVHPMVRFFENPESRFAFRGAISLEGHDIIHCILGRGLTDQDEAFVLGYTMGTASFITKLETVAFRFVLQLYPEPYRIQGEDLKAFDLGVETGKKCGTKNLYNYPLTELYPLTIAQIRNRLGIYKHDLINAYEKEREMIPNSPASLRLPI